MTQRPASRTRCGAMAREDARDALMLHRVRGTAKLIYTFLLTSTFLWNRLW
jgi:hypothetical protein